MLFYLRIRYFVKLSKITPTMMTTATTRMTTTTSTMKMISTVLLHYYDVIMGAMPSQITSLMIVYSTVYSVADLRKHQSSASLPFVMGTDLRLNKRLSKQWWGWWFETPSRLLWRHCNVSVAFKIKFYLLLKLHKLNKIIWRILLDDRIFSSTE